MLRKVAASTAEGALHHPWRSVASRSSSSLSKSSAINSVLLRSLKDHYLEVSKMSPPPKVNPPSPFTIVKGALDSNGPVLRRTYGNEEISILALRMNNILEGGVDDDVGDDSINQLFVHVSISKPGQTNALHFLCGLYPDALGVHSASLRPMLDPSGFLEIPSKYNGPTFEDLNEKMRDVLHGYIDERGINDSLFPFLQAWLYVKDHRNLMKWFKSVGNFIAEPKQVKAA